MRFICILLLFICCDSYAADRETLFAGNANEFQPAISNHDQPHAEEPVTLRSSMAITRYSVVKKLVDDPMLPRTVLIFSRSEYLPAPVVAAPGIHVKNYLRHIYPALHFW